MRGLFHLDLYLYQLPENGHPEPEPLFPFFHEPQSLGLQSALFLLEVAAGFTAAFFEAQQLFASPAAAGFACLPVAAASGHSAVPARGHFAHDAGSQFEPLHCALVAAALTFSVLLQP